MPEVGIIVGLLIIIFASPAYLRLLKDREKEEYDKWVTNSALARASNPNPYLKNELADVAKYRSLSLQSDLRATNMKKLLEDMEKNTISEYEKTQTWIMSQDATLAISGQKATDRQNTLEIIERKRAAESLRYLQEESKI